MCQNFDKSKKGITSKNAAKFLLLQLNKEYLRHTLEMMKMLKN